MHIIQYKIMESKLHGYRKLYQQRKKTTRNLVNTRNMAERRNKSQNTNKLIQIYTRPNIYQRRTKRRTINTTKRKYPIHRQNTNTM